MKKKQAIEVLRNLIKTTKLSDVEITLFNADTGKSLHPDAEAIKVGIVVGLAGGISALRMQEQPKSEDDYESVIEGLFAKASEQYLKTLLVSEAKGKSNA